MFLNWYHDRAGIVAVALKLGIPENEKTKHGPALSSHLKKE